VVSAEWRGLTSSSRGTARPGAGAARRRPRSRPSSGMRWAEPTSSSRLLCRQEPTDVSISTRNRIRDGAPRTSFLNGTYDLTRRSSSPSGLESRVRPWPTCSGPHRRRKRSRTPSSEGKIGEGHFEPYLPLPFRITPSARGRDSPKVCPSAEAERRLPRRMVHRHAVVGRGPRSAAAIRTSLR